MQKEFEGVLPIYVLEWKYLVAMPYYSRYTYRQIYCEESWVDTKVTDANGEVHYKKRYM